MQAPAATSSVTRNSDLLVDEAEADDLLKSWKTCSRSASGAIRCGSKVAHNCPEQMHEYLVEKLRWDRDDVYHCNGPST